MKYKAEFLFKVKDKYDIYKIYLFYKYRGFEYMITDYRNGCSETLATQHSYEQKRIDKIIERNENQKIDKNVELFNVNEIFEIYGWD